MLKCLLDVAYGVEYMHFNGILHGDLKCANVLCKACSTDIRGFICKVRPLIFLGLLYVLAVKGFYAILDTLLD